MKASISSLLDDGSCTVPRMKELVRRPAAKVERRMVEAALLRLLRYPGTFSVGAMMRMVDEYAASLHTARVYQHAERIVGEALVDAHRAVELGKNIFVCVVLNDAVEVEAVGKFFNEEKNFLSQKKFFKWTSDSAFPVWILVDDANPTCQECLKSPISPDSPECRIHPECPGCPICRNTIRTPTDDASTVRAETECHPSPIIRTETDGVRTDDTSTVRALTDDLSPIRALTDDTATARAHGDMSHVVVSSVSGPPSDGTGSTPTDRTETPNVDTDGYGDGKSCTRCGRTLPLIAYSSNRARPDGHASACRECESARKRGLPLPVRTTGATVSVSP